MARSTLGSSARATPRASARASGLRGQLALLVDGLVDGLDGADEYVDDRADDVADHVADDVEPVVEVRRSARRRRTVSAYRDGDRTVVLLPARLTKAEEREWVATMLDQLAARERRSRPGDEELMTRAVALSRRYLGGRARPVSVRWVANQREQWGSCTPADGTIRLSDRLLGMPPWVIDYVLVHELAHLLVPSHGPDFWLLVDRFPKVERARGFLEGLTAAASPGSG